MDTRNRYAPGWPGIPARWTSHFELAAGKVKEAERLQKALESFASEEGLLPEQIWDEPDMPKRELFFGRPSGSAMPLVWAHAEYLKLLRSLHDGRVFDMPPQTVQRYLVEKIGSPFTVWRFNHKCRTMAAGKTLRVETMAPALVHWSVDGWLKSRDSESRDTHLGVHLADLNTSGLPSGTEVVFTIYWPGASRWEGGRFHRQSHRLIP